MQDGFTTVSRKGRVEKRIAFKSHYVDDLYEDKVTYPLDKTRYVQYGAGIPFQLPEAWIDC